MLPIIFLCFTIFDIVPENYSCLVLRIYKYIFFVPKKRMIHIEACQNYSFEPKQFIQ